MASRLPKALVAGSVPPVAWAGNPPAVIPVLALAPSTVNALTLGRCPLAENCPASPRVAGVTLTLEAASSRVSKPAPLSGRRAMSPRSNSVPTETSTRSKGEVVPSTVMVSSMLPTGRAKSATDARPLRSTTLKRTKVRKPSLRAMTL